MLIGLWFAIASVVGVVITLFGYAHLAIAHPAPGELPVWVAFAIPLAVFGPDAPSWNVFMMLWLANILAWAFVFTVPVGIVFRRLGR